MVARSTAGAALVLCGLVCACGGSGGTQTTGRVGSSIALLSDGELAVVNPDQGAVSFVDASTLEVRGTLVVGGHPRALLEASGSGLVWVTTHQGGHVVLVDPKGPSVVETLDVCSGTTGLAESADGAFIAVACEWGGQVMRIDTRSHAVTGLASELSRPSSVAIVGDSIVVGELTGGNMVELSKGVTTRVSLVPPSAPYRPALTQMTANLASAVVSAFGQVFVAHELVNHTGDMSDEIVADDYGHVLNGTPKINSAVTALSLSGETVSNAAQAPPVYARFDAPAHAFCGPVALAPFGDRYLLVAHVSTNDVALLDTQAVDPAQRLVASWTTGAGPSGVAVDEKAQLAYVDNMLDGSISILDLSKGRDASAPTWPVKLTRVLGLTPAYSSDALAGRKIFFDATNPHQTPSRTVACATCHPAGADDGLIWFIRSPNIPLKRRRTPHLSNAHTATAPFHWDGQFTTMPELVHSTMTELMAGDALLVDTNTIQPFIDEIVETPEAPPQDTAAAARGKDVFRSAQCDTCHVGALLTDDQSHIVLTPESLSTDDLFTTANTPALHGLWFRAPFFHDGRSKDLRDLLTRPDATLGGASQLTPSQLDDLIVFLETL